MAKEVLGVAGAAVGFVVTGGSVQGALIGFNVGYSLGSYLDPGTIPHPGLNDAPIQTSRDGVPITLFWGLQYGHGNIVQKNPEEIVTDTEGGGKGQPDVETQSRFRTFAIGVGQSSIGPLAEITRIWENGRLVYDVRAEPAIPVEETEAYAENITIYLGDEAQLPDPELEAHWGADNTPAYRGLCYIVWNNYDLTDTGGAIPQFAFEVNASKDRTITSKPYPVEVIESMQTSAAPVSFGPAQTVVEGLQQTVAITGIDIAPLLVGYEIDPEGIEQTVVIDQILLQNALVDYELTEGIEQTVVITEILLAAGRVEYEYEIEGIEQTVAITDITLT
jgi:hypothetical protein